MITGCKQLEHCLCCHKKVNLVLDLKNQPLANDFHEIDEEVDLFPLRLMGCPNCFHCQLSHAVDPDILFKNYKYITGTNNTIVEFFDENAKFITNYVKNPENVLDIACNDGSQLDSFKKLGWKTYGVDPAENIYSLSTGKGHHIICDFWNFESAKKLPKMDVILAQNVFAHTEYLDEFLQVCKTIMDDNSSLFIQTSQKNMIINNEFDTTYHEHISFFNTKSMNELVLRNGLVLNRVLENEIHGTSYIFEIKKVKDDSIYNVDEVLNNEKNNNLFNPDLYKNFALNSVRSLEKLKNTIVDYKSNGFKCIGFGASAKGQVTLCAGDIELDYIIDESPLKMGLYSPKLNIPIVGLKTFENDNSEKFLIVILAWNFSKEIISKILGYNKKSKIVIIQKYFPFLEIIEQRG